jgi:molybdopterin converting factor small subunit
LARLLLFAQARECAGTNETAVGGATVGEVLDAAVERYGERFGAVVAFSAVWLNGDPAARAEPVGDDDEVAVLPPVSGGSD